MHFRQFLSFCLIFLGYPSKITNRLGMYEAKQQQKQFTVTNAAYAQPAIDSPTMKASKALEYGARKLVDNETIASDCTPTTDVHTDDDNDPIKLNMEKLKAVPVLRVFNKSFFDSETPRL